MSRTVKRTLGLALALYAGSYCVYRIGLFIYPDPYFGSTDIWQWTMWDYTSCALLVAAVGFTLAAYWLKQTDNFNRQMEER